MMDDSKWESHFFKSPRFCLLTWFVTSYSIYAIWTSVNNCRFNLWTTCVHCCTCGRLVPDDITLPVVSIFVIDVFVFYLIIYQVLNFSKQYWQYLAQLLIRAPCMCLCRQKDEFGVLISKPGILEEHLFCLRTYLCNR